MKQNDPWENPTPDSSKKEPEYMEFEVEIPQEELPPQKKKSPINLKVFFRSLFLTLLIAILVLVAWRGGVFAVDYFTAKKDGLTHSEALNYAWSGTVSFFTDIVEEVSPIMLEDKNILLIGSDKSKINADVIMLIRLDSDAKAVDIISILRDTKITYNGRNYKLNASLQLGGEELLTEYVEDILNVEIDNFVFINYEGFRKVIDALGGVDFYVPCDMFYEDPEQDLYINLKEGPQHLDGKKAEGLVRYRQYPMGDIARTQVQRDFLIALYKQKLNSDIIKNARTIVPAVMDFMDTDLGLSDALQLVNFVKDFDMESINAYQIPVKIPEQSPYVLADEQGIAQMFEEIEKSRSPIVEGEEPSEHNYRDDIVDASGRDIN